MKIKTKIDLGNVVGQTNGCDIPAPIK